MSKRFIDTCLFDDDWFMELSMEAKLLWVYFITKCNHAGILKINTKLCKVQTDIEDLDKIIQELGNRLVTVGEHLFFIPKFVEYQYPGFPNCKFNAALSAISELERYGIIVEGKLTVPQEFMNSYSNSNSNSKEKESEEKPKKDKQIKIEKYLPLAKYLYQIILTKKNVKRSLGQIKTWADQIRIMIEVENISYERIEKALQWYEKHIGEEYVVEIESGKSLREKFIRLETASTKEPFVKRNGKPEKTMEYGEWWFLQDDGKYRNAEGELLVK